MADIGTQDAVRAGLLDAIASGGKAAGKAYTDAQTALQGQNADAVRAALSNSVAAGLPQEAQAQLSRTISQPYQNRIGQLQENAATSQDYFGKLGAAQGAFSQNVSALMPALEAQVAAKSKGGGGSSSTPNPLQVLIKEYGGSGNAAKAISSQAAQVAAAQKIPSWVAEQQVGESLGLSADEVGALGVGKPSQYNQYVSNLIATHPVAGGNPRTVAYAFATPPAQRTKYQNTILKKLGIGTGKGQPGANYLAGGRADPEAAYIIQQLGRRP